MNTAKLKAAAEKVRWVDWSAYKPHSGARGYEVRAGSEAVAQHCLKDDAAFIAEASPKTVLCLIAALEAAEEMVELQRFKLERQAEDLHQAKSLESIHREKRYEVEREFSSYKHETDRNVRRLASEVIRLEDALELAGINLETGVKRERT